MKKQQIAWFYASSFPTANGEEKDKGKRETVVRLAIDERSTKIEIRPSANSGESFGDCVQPRRPRTGNNE
jgi:hypothetical protein